MTARDEFDAELLRLIAQGVSTHDALAGGELSPLAFSIAPNVHTSRFLDRRLQALRKAGKIKYDRFSGWTRT